MNEFLKVASDIAREAGAILRKEFDRPKTISYKGEVDIVTESDRRSEAVIVARLREHFPGHAIVAEEGGGAAAAGAKYCWHVDPLDGTTNFAHGYPCFAVSIGLAEDGEPVAGVVFNPVTEEFFSAARGEGAYLNERPIHVSSIEKLATSLVATGFPTHHRKRSANINYYWEFTLRSHGVRRDGSAALDLCSVACGRFDAFWEFRLNSWDTAAGVLLVREAGGIVTDIKGGPYSLGGPALLASNGLIHEEMRGVAEIAERANP
ncbi:MAG TPA: inositol monophosphatase family protein [Candidatus Aquilonibacter sp.]|nr:inositol monophosphatase family protein [Candidatus Aquilonibacter sp.]